MPYLPTTPTPSRLIPTTALTPTTFSPYGQVIQNPSTHSSQPSHLTRLEANQGSATKYLDVTHMHDWYATYSPSGTRAKCVVNMFVCKPRKLQKLDGGIAKQGFAVKILERHPFTPQTFVPVGLSADDTSTCYLVIVAPTLPANKHSSSRGRGGEKEPVYPLPPPTRRKTIKERLLGARPNPFTNDYVASTTPTTTEKETASEGPQRPKGPGLPDLANLRAFIARGDQAVTYGPGTWHAPMVVLGEKAIDFVVVQYANGVGVEDCQEVEIRTGDGGSGLVVEVDGSAAQGVGVVKAKL